MLSIEKYNALYIYFEFLLESVVYIFLFIKYDPNYYCFTCVFTPYSNKSESISPAFAFNSLTKLCFGLLLYCCCCYCARIR